MNYLYDIFLNLNNTFYDYVEWNNDDIFTHFKKIPLLKVSKKTITDILCYDISNIENELISEIFSKKGVQKSNKYLILSDGKNSIGIEIYNKKIINISSMIPEEEDEANNSIKKNDIVNFNYKKDKKKTIKFKTRLTIDKENFIKKKLKYYFEHENYELLDYIYYECVGHDKSNKKIKDFLNNDIDKLYELLKIINV